MVELPNDRTETYIRAIKEQVKSSLQMVVIIFPSQRDDRYSSLKKLCCIDSPVPSQVGPQSIPLKQLFFFFLISTMLFAVSCVTK